MRWRCVCVGAVGIPLSSTCMHYSLINLSIKMNPSPDYSINNPWCEGLSARGTGQRLTCFPLSCSELVTALDSCASCSPPPRQSWRTLSVLWPSPPHVASHWWLDTHTHTPTEGHCTKLGRAGVEMGEMSGWDKEEPLSWFLILFLSIKSVLVCIEMQLRIVWRIYWT